MTVNALLDSATHKSQTENIYIGFDKPYYAVGDTIWFKAYLLSTAYLTASQKSGILYVDIFNDSSKTIRNYRLQVINGLAWGNIFLERGDFASGAYTVRAYTNWMRNTREDHFFYKRFYVSNFHNDALLTNAIFSEKAINGDSQLNALLHFTTLEKIPYAVEEMQLQVISGGNKIYQQKLKTGIDGALKLDFKLPSKPVHLAIIAENKSKEEKAVIPIILNRPSNTDIQFFPEGGDLIAGIPANIGFKAIGEDGKGVDVNGMIVDQQKKKVASFNSLYKGMGSFTMQIKDNEDYTAEIRLPDGNIKSYHLPAVKKSGTVLQVANVTEKDSLGLCISATDDLLQSDNSYFLIGRSRGIVCYAAFVEFHGSNIIRKRISKNIFPTGIIHFTLLNANYQPLNERRIFIDHHDYLNFRCTTDKLTYGERDSIALKVTVTDVDDQPIKGNFFVSVTDDTQVKQDSLKDNILTRFLLTADLKGYVENAGYYYPCKSGDAWIALDNLLLTQGWIGYDWQQILRSDSLKFESEKGLRIAGTVTNAFNKPITGSNVILFSKHPQFLLDNLTNNQGRFLFNNLPPTDTPFYVLQARNKRGNGFNVSLSVDNGTSPIFNKPKYPEMLPWYVNADSTIVNFIRTDAHQRQLQYFSGSGQMLKEVNITAKKIVKGSFNLNGSGNADIALDEKDMEKAAKTSFLNLFEEKIPGFREGYYRTPASAPAEIKAFENSLRGASESEWYFIHDKPVVLVMDGIDIEDIIPDFNFLQFMTYLKSHSAEDIKGVEVNFSSRYNSNYLIKVGKFRSAPIDLSSYRDFAFIEITTRSGNSAIIKNTPGLYIFRPLAISYPKQFYKPKYSLTDTARYQSDLRSTLTWEPNVITNKDGNATISFFSADSAPTYTIIIEGTDMNGNLGFFSKKINIRKKEQHAK
ncbi:MAG: carboxypeptidase-like regulatory domain-containing protein [Mucilaginibacter sp.]